MCFFPITLNDIHECMCIVTSLIVTLIKNVLSRLRDTRTMKVSSCSSLAGLRRGAGRMHSPQCGCGFLVALVDSSQGEAKDGVFWPHVESER